MRGCQTGLCASRRLANLALAFAGIALFAGCAAPNEPSARQPLIPKAIGDLAARQQGDSVILTFTLPRDSVADKPLPESPTVEIYRGSSAPMPAPVNPIGVPPPRKLPGQLVDTIPSSMVDGYLKNGRFEFPDPLDPVDLAAHAGQQLFYTVRTRASRTRDSADSNTIALHVYPPPQPVGDLRAMQAEQAIVLTWTPPVPAPAVSSAPPLFYRVYRAEVAPENAAAALANPSQALSQSKLATPLALLAEPPEASYRDTTFEWNHVYVYTARAAFRFGSDVVEAADPVPVVIAAEDVFPPAPPQGLEAVIVPATLEAPPYVELTWGIGPEADLAGYVVYRSEQPETQGERQNMDLLPAPTFRDTSVAPGKRYFYRVAAVDRSGNESPVSPAVVADIPSR